MSTIEDGLYNFALEFYKKMELFKDNPNDNTLVSPFLLSTALSAILYGAKDNTQSEILESIFGSGVEVKALLQHMSMLIEKALKSNGKQLSAANFIYVNSKFSILPEFQQTVEKSMAVKARPLDSSKISKDISEATNGKVTNYKAQLQSQDGLVLAQAFALKGAWKLKFLPTNTEVEKFRTNTGEQIDVEMMFESNKYRTGYCDELRANAVELEYDNSNVVFIVLKPYTNSSLEELGYNIDANTVANLINNLSQPIRIDLYLPKFKLEANTRLTPFLDKMGIKDVFEKDGAKLSGIAKDSKGLAISEIVQTVSITLEEEGVEAEVPTAYQFKPKEFKANRPFMFLVVSRYADGKSVILFTGAVNNPKK